MQVRELKTPDLSGFLTVEEAAKLLGIKETSIRMYLSKGKLVTYKLKTLTLLKMEELKRWKENRK